MELDASAVRHALAGDRHALRRFVTAMTPVIHARVVRGLLRRRGGVGGRDVRQEVEDMTQDVFSALFAHDGRALRAWDPQRGLSLPNFVGLIADRQVASSLRSGRKDPWRDVPEELDRLESGSEPVPTAEPQVASRHALERLLDRLRTSLSPRGLELFQRLYVDGESIEDVAPVMGMTREAIYAWRNRVGKLIRAFAAEVEDDSSLDGGATRRSSKGAG
jgi:RNA polymerase sigma factor (sigma-70 family)